MHVVVTLSSSPDCIHIGAALVMFTTIPAVDTTLAGVRGKNDGGEVKVEKTKRK